MASTLKLRPLATIQLTGTPGDQDSIVGVLAWSPPAAGEITGTLYCLDPRADTPEVEAAGVFRDLDAALEHVRASYALDPDTTWLAGAEHFH